VSAVPRSAVESVTVLMPVLSSAPDGEPPTKPLLSPDEALQVLTLAQRTAENHVTAANRHARTVLSEAQTSAEQIRSEAHAYAAKVRAEADKLLADARAAAEMRSRDAEAQAAEIRRRAESTLDSARAEAERIIAGGLDRAKQLDVRAQQRYDDEVGSLSIKREALQKQIEALASFDAEYRHRLAQFMHAQLRALWIEQAGVHEVPGGPVT
jgi:vacuolar-type H+-ATPase subunit H